MDPVDSVTAVDYLENQLQLERESRELLPFDPDTCTYPQPLRQSVYACLTCSRANNRSPVGVCYSCSIQCHSTHELVELFTKRNFACDCGTTRMANGSACSIRARAAETVSDQQQNQQNPVPRLRTGSGSSSFAFSRLDLPKADDIPSSDNTYNHNFQGRFCSCNVLYNPLVETRTMHQCYFGDACGEDWYHQDCILGYKPGLFVKQRGSGTNLLDSLSAPGPDAATEAEEKKRDEKIKEESETTEEEAKASVKNESKESSKNDSVKREYEESEEAGPDSSDCVPHFPPLDSFDEFICWKCVQKNPALLELSSHVFTMPHLNNVDSAAKWHSLAENQPAKKVKTENHAMVPVSLFLRTGFRKEFAEIASRESPLSRLLKNNPYLYEEDPIYQPDEDQASESSQSSLFEMGSKALSSLPVPQAIEGLQAYDNLKDQLKGFFKNFVDQNRVVTEKEVRDFFGKMEKRE